MPSPESYGDCLDKSELPLVSLRVEEYNGMIFASFKEDIQPLEEFLGPAKKWIDLFMKQGAGYPIKVLGEHVSVSRVTGKSSLKIPPMHITSRWYTSHS